jgi:hypothetical protein
MVSHSRPRLGHHSPLLPGSHYGASRYVPYSSSLYKGYCAYAKFSTGFSFFSFSCFPLVSSVLLLLGYKIDSIQKDVVELKATYDAYGAEEPLCGIGENYDANKTCTVTFTVPKNMDPPILVHYELTNFYQNHRSYYGSRDPYQLRGEEPPSKSAQDVAELDCKPLYKLGDTLLNPCGMTANTMFNDIFTLTGGKDIYGKDLVLIEEGIAWASDLEYSFKQLLDFRSEVCPNNGSCTDDCCDGDEWSCKGPALNKKDDLCYRYNYPNEETTQYLYETYPKIVSPLEGVENEHFIVWMRVAAHGSFRKLYGWIDQPVAEGTMLTFDINANYVVTRFQGSKSLMVGNTSIFGGRNEHFSIVFIGVGYFCLIAAVFFAVKQKFRPRRLADPAYLHFKED